MIGPLEELDADARAAMEETPQPSFVQPMLATLHDRAFSDPGWIYERKLDGVRLLAFRESGEVRLKTRNEKDRSETYFEIRDALADPDAPDLVVDGEVVAFDGKVTSFSRLQNRIQVTDEEEARRRAEEVGVEFYLFDLLHLDGHDLTALPLRTRKSLLRTLLDFEDPIHFTPHRDEEGEAYLDEACERGWEGLIAKKADSPYRHSRSTDWLKLKCVNRQEFVVGGWTDPEGSRIGFGALLVGYHDGGDLVYAGKVGTGYDDDTLERLGRRLEDLERETSPFQEADRIDESGVHWVTPKLVCEVEFTEWTDAGKLRHPRFEGLRDDKDPDDVVRERPVRERAD